MVVLEDKAELEFTFFIRNVVLNKMMDNFFVDIQMSYGIMYLFISKNCRCGKKVF